MSPNVRASLAALLFTFVGALGFFVGGVWRYEVGVPLAVFYFLLVLNTFFSVRYFAAMTKPNDIVQNCFDAVLILFYIWLAFSLREPLQFAFVLTVFFGVTVLKYVLLRRGNLYRAIISRKMYMNAGGCAFSLLSLMLMGAGYVFPTVLVGTGAFIALTVYLLYVNPMYRTLPKTP